MSKKENHKQDLLPLFDSFFQTGDEGEIIEYLISHSNLPGRRANLELGQAFAEAVEAHSAEELEKLWGLGLKLIGFSPEQAPTNDPKEFLPFCGAWAVGAMGAVSPGFFQEALSHLRELAGDPRWRVREAVAKGLQKLIEKHGPQALEELEGWIVAGNWLAMRAAAAGVAEPALLKDTQTATSALELHRKIFDRVLEAQERKSEEFKALRKGLGYTLSVVVAAIPEEGFEYLERLVNSRDQDILWIIRENLKKNRLIKNFPKNIESTKALLKGVE